MLFTGKFMRFRLVVPLLIALSVASAAFGQHGQADSGLYNFNYNGDTWTGKVTEFDKASKSLTLTYEHKGQTGTFTGLIKPAIHFVNKDGQDVDPATVRVNIGDQMTVYYIKEGLKYPVMDGTKPRVEVAKANIIFKIKPLEQLKSSLAQEPQQSKPCIAAGEQIFQPGIDGVKPPQSQPDKDEKDAPKIRGQVSLVQSRHLARDMVRRIGSDMGCCQQLFIGPDLFYERVSKIRLRLF
jgi:hypothetical protein